MRLDWVRDNPPYWNADKVRIVGSEPPGVFHSFSGGLEQGSLVPGQWWQVMSNGRTVGFGWLDVVWGDAEISLASDRELRNRGVGSFVLERLDEEARRQGLNYLYNVVPPAHPDGDRVSTWLMKRGFQPGPEGRLVRPVRPGIEA